MFKEDLFKRLDPILKEWADFVLAELVSNSRSLGLRDKKVKGTGDLIKSLQKQIILNASSGLARVILGFNPYGRILDLKQTDHSRQPPVDLLEEYIREVGLSQFRQPRSLKRIKRLRGENAAIRDLAWRLSKSIFLKTKKKRRKWRFSKIFYSTITRLRTKIAVSLTAAQLELLNKIEMPKVVNIKI